MLEKYNKYFLIHGRRHTTKNILGSVIWIFLLVPALMLLGGCRGGSSNSGDSANVDAVTNMSPTADTGGSYSGMEGDAIGLSSARSSDSDGTITAYALDFDNDGKYTRPPVSTQTSPHPRQDFLRSASK